MSVFRSLISIIQSVGLVLGWALFFYFAYETNKQSQKIVSLQHDLSRMIWARISEKHQNSSSTERIIKTRDFVYRKTQVGYGNLSSRDPIAHFLMLDANSISMVCDGMAKTYTWVLDQLGIRSREVILATEDFVKGFNKYDTHMAVEVFDSAANKWYVSDPTFNVSFSCNGKGGLLDFEEMHSCKESGGDIVAVSNGETYIKGRTVQEYYLPYEKLLYAMWAKEVRDDTGNLIRAELNKPYGLSFQEALRQYR